MKPENEFLGPPVFMVSVLGLPLFLIGMGLAREADLGLEEEDLVGEDGPSERRFWV